jgi:hypothetical protein
MLILSSFAVSFMLTYLLYEALDFTLPIRAGGIWGLAIGFIFSWSLYLSLRHRFPRVETLGDQVKVLRAKNPVGQLIAARISVLALAITRASALVAGLYGGIGVWALIRMHVSYIQSIAQLSFVGFGLAIGIMVAGTLLERLCSPPSGEGVLDSKQAT